MGSGSTSKESPPVIDISDDGMLVIEAGDGSGIYEDPSREVAELDRMGLLDIEGQNGCRIVITQPDPDETFHDSEYVEWLARLVVLIGDMFDVDNTTVVEAVELKIWGMSALE